MVTDPDDDEARARDTIPCPPPSFESGEFELPWAQRVARELEIPEAFDENAALPPTS